MTDVFCGGFGWFFFAILLRKPGNYGGINLHFLARWNANDNQRAFLLAKDIMFIPLGVLLPMFGRIFAYVLSKLINLLFHFAENE